MQLKLITFFVVLANIFPAFFFENELEMEQKKEIPDRCRSYADSLLLKEGKIDKYKISGHDSSCACGLESTERIPFVHRIVSTHFVQPLHRYPWQVQIRIAGEQWGAGVIINPSYVLTAGHVAKNILVASAYSEDNEVSLRDASVAVATQSKNSQFVTFRIHQIKIHPSFGTSGEHPIYDIALLKLKDAIIFSKRVRPICLTLNRNLEKAGLNATIIGWGKMEQGGNSTRRLKEGLVPLIETAECKKQLHKHKRAIGEFTLCAGGNKNEDACEGDSGGPLQIQDECGRWNLLGITSWGEGCGQSALPGVYARVYFFLGWIIDETLDGMACDSTNLERVEPNLKECGIPSYRYMKTGVAVRMLDNPWVVSINYGFEFLGNGVLVNSTVVLTSTSVVSPWGPSLKTLRLRATLGSPARYRNASDYLYDYAYVKSVIFHPMAEHRFDLCLLVLGVPMADTLMKFHPICFTNFKIPFAVADKVDISSYTGALLHEVKAANGRLKKLSACKALRYGASFRYRNKCVAQVSRNYRPMAFDSYWAESCQEEKGAVITRSIESRKYLLGLSALAPENCTSPRLFQDVNWALPWIRTICTMLNSV